MRVIVASRNRNDKSLLTHVSVPCCYYFRIKMMFGSSLPPVACLIDVICVCLRIVVSNTYCVVFFVSLRLHE
jgi:hypothetical protein